MSRSVSVPTLACSGVGSAFAFAGSVAAPGFLRFVLWAGFFLAGCGTTTVYDHDAPAPTRAAEEGRSRRAPEAGEARPGKRPGGEVAARCQRHLDLVARAGEREGVDWAVLAGIATVESKWTPSVRNRSGASGLMQIMPATGRRLECGDLLDAAQNVACGARLMRRLLNRYDERMPYALAAYAAGARSVDRAYAAGARPPRERFVARVLALSTAFRTRGCEAVELAR